MPKSRQVSLLHIYGIAVVDIENMQEDIYGNEVRYNPVELQ